MPRPPSAAALLLLTGVLLTGCSSSGGGSDDASQPPVGAFADGTCRGIAQDVLDVGEQLPLLGDGPSVEEPVLAALGLRQERLRGPADQAEAEVSAPLEDLVLSLGLVRARAEGGTYDGALTGHLQRSYDELVAVCTDGSSS